jgi:hypothetical protein
MNGRAGPPVGRASSPDDASPTAVHGSLTRRIRRIENQIAFASNVRDVADARLDQLGGELRLLIDEACSEARDDS